ncbi:MAG: helix-turn-helix transcriptional regulator [Alphaproteobacteria bacterium]|nr:helix-turn-helix transcriptional regulator [Alphaproteobacteria bacterium]
MTNWPDRIREIRFREGWKQGDMARALGVSQASVSQWERGIHAPPRRLHDCLFQKLSDGSHDRLFLALRASVASSPNLCGLFSLKDGQVIIEAQSEAGYELYPLLNREDIGKPINGKLGPEMDQAVEFLIEAGAWDGRVSSARICGSAKRGDLEFCATTTHTPFMIENGVWVVRSECRIYVDGERCCQRHGEPFPHMVAFPV